MNYVTRDEFSARIELIETRIDARIESMSLKIDGFLVDQTARDKAREEIEVRQENVRLEREHSQEQARLERERSQEEIRIARERNLEELRQERKAARLEREKSQDKILVAQEKAHLERDKRYELLGNRLDRSIERMDEAMEKISSIKPHYWAATTVQFLGMIAILVGSFYANQANVLVTMQTTLAMVQSVKEGSISTLTAPSAMPRE